MSDSTPNLPSAETLLQSVIDALPQAIFIKDLNYRFIHANQTFIQDAGLKQPEQIIGHTDYELPWNNNADMYRQDDQAVLESGEPKYHIDDRITHADGSITWTRTTKLPLKNEHGTIVGLLGWYQDITREKTYEAEAIQLREEIISAQADALRELSTPLIPISENVVAMPLVGTIDEERAQMILESLLSGLGQYQAQIAILDITGVPVIDTQVADALVKSAQAVRLLGAQVMLTGIRPEVAQTLVSLGADLSSIKTYSNLQTAIFAALNIND